MYGGILFCIVMGGIFVFMYIDNLKEYELIQSLLNMLPRVDAKNTVILNVSPDYSSTVAMHIAHHLSEDGEMLDMVSVDVPYPDQDRDYYELKFKRESLGLPAFYSTVILVEAAVLSGNNYTWIKQRLLDRGYQEKDIITVALLEMNNSKFKCDYVGAYSDTMPEFYYERYNKHWD